jgi:UDP-N-acetylmuramate--alanine ligase
MPADDMPADDMPADDMPADDMPADDMPADDMPADDMPADDMRAHAARLDLRQPKRIHIVGIGGAGMSAIAVVLRAMGHTVTGSDLKESSVSARLRAQGIEVAIGHRAENVGAVDAVTYSPAVALTNIELTTAAVAGALLVPRSGVLAAICATRRCLAVTGTKGKTTTASMLSLILIEAGLHPSFLIGADVNEVGTNAVWDQGDWLVVEADESYGTFADIRPDLAVLTNVEPDHLDHYGTLEHLTTAFSDFIGLATQGAVVSADNPGAAAIGRAHGGATVGTDNAATHRMTEVVESRSSVSFRLLGPEGDLGPLTIGVPGLHNARNAALAAVAGLQVGVPMATVASALARFAGVSRRFEFRGEARGVTFVDDYAHLPFAVRAALATARTGGWARVVAVFQPHRYTRTAELAQEFGPAFIDADLLVVTEIYSAGETPIPGVSGRLVADAVRAQDPRLPVLYAPGWEELRLAVSAQLQPGDLCLTLGAGDLTMLPDQLLDSPQW